VARVCRRVDGIPLAIELAAARLTALSVEDLARRVDDRFRLLTGGLRTALPRQRTLRALVDWSYELLSTQERSVLETLAVFAGGFTLEGAEHVVDAVQLRDMTLIDALEHLVAKSMVLVDRGTGSDTRYRLLETIRQYAGEKLMERGGIDAARRRHFDYFAALAQRGAEALYGPYALEWLDRLEAEQENLRAALDWSAAVAPQDHARLAGLLARFWDIRGHFSEGWERLAHALTTHKTPDAARLSALIGAGLLAHRLDLTARSDEALVEALALAETLRRPEAECDALLCLAMNRAWAGGDAVEPLARRALTLARTLGDVAQQGMALLMTARAMNARSTIMRAHRRCSSRARSISNARAACCGCRWPCSTRAPVRCICWIFPPRAGCSRMRCCVTAAWATSTMPPAPSACSGKPHSTRAGTKKRSRNRAKACASSVPCTIRIAAHCRRWCWPKRCAPRAT
jgi:non-specific serine/threonine protein kinase